MGDDEARTEAAPLDGPPQSLTPEDRFRLIAKLQREFRESVIAGIRRDFPGISEIEERVQLFLRLYAKDFTPQRVERTVATIRAGSAAAS